MLGDNQVEKESCRAWQLSLREERKKRDFFQAGNTPKKQKLNSVTAPRKWSKRGRPPKSKVETDLATATSTSVCIGSTSAVTSPKEKKLKSELMVIEEGDDIPVENEPLHGRVVWAQFGNFQSFYPAVVIKGSMVNLATGDSGLAFVYWFSDKKVSTVPRSTMLDFKQSYLKKIGQCHGKMEQRGVYKAIVELQRRDEVSDYVDPLQWAQEGFPPPGGIALDAESKIIERLEDIGKDIRQKAALKERDIENTFHNENAIAAVRNGRKCIADICIGCADLDRKVSCLHPIFEGGLCNKCKEYFQDTFYAIGEDGTSSYCTVCGCGGQLFVCDSPQCGRVFCIPCVEELGGEDVLEKVKTAKAWPCFLCRPYKASTHGLIKPLADWRGNVDVFFNNQGEATIVPDLEYFKLHRPIRVLSLFDGIGTALLALKEAGLQIEVYFACEADEQAKTISQVHHNIAIQEFGDITRVQTDKLAEITPIDLLIGGSPCNQLSFECLLQNDFNPESGLFFEFYRVLRGLKKLNGPATHLFWLFQSTSSIHNCDRNTIFRFLECQPAVWEATALPVQSRTRFFWGNIPGLHSVQHARNISFQPNSLEPFQRSGCYKWDSSDGGCILELERLLGYPAHYTEVANLSHDKRQTLLNRSWSVHVLSQILKPLTEYFAGSDD